MTFIYPSFLWALMALIIPVLIHLFNFQRPKVLLFPNLKFLKEIQQQTRTIRQLRRYLVLAARLTALAALVLAFCQPVLNTNKLKTQGNGQPLVVIYVDNSYSMQASASQGTLLDVAIASAERTINQYPSQTRFHILTNDFNSQGAAFVTKQEALNVLRNISFSNNFRNSSAISSRVQAVFQQQTSANRQCLIFSDFQKSTLGEVKNLNKDSLTNYQIIPIYLAQQPNLVIDTAYLETPMVLAGETNTLMVQVRNTGSEAANNIPLKVILNDVQISAQLINVLNGGTFMAKVNVQLSSEQIASGKILIDDQPNSFDNAFYFTLKPSKPIKVIAINEKLGSYIPKAFDNKKLFSLKECVSSSIDYEALKSSNFIVLNELNTIDASLADALKQGSKRKSILVIPAKNPQSASYSSLFSSLNMPMPALQSNDTATASQSIAIPKSNDPFFKGVFENNNERLISPLVPHVWQVSGSKILGYQSGKTAVAQYKLGSASLYVAAGPLSYGDRSVAKSALFLPVLYKMAFNAASDIERIAYNFQEGQIQIPVLDSVVSETPYQLSSGKTSLIPQQQLRNGVLLMSLPHTEAVSGIYNLMQGNKSLDKIALNYSKTESYLESYTIDNLKTELGAYPNFKISSAIKDSSSGADIFVEQQGYPLWKYLIYLALAALLFEIIIIRFVK